MAPPIVCYAGNQDGYAMVKCIYRRSSGLASLPPPCISPPGREAVINALYPSPAGAAYLGCMHCLDVQLENIVQDFGDVFPIFFNPSHPSGLEDNRLGAGGREALSGRADFGLIRDHLRPGSDIFNFVWRRISCTWRSTRSRASCSSAFVMPGAGDKAPRREPNTIFLSWFNSKVTAATCSRRSASRRNCCSCCSLIGSTFVLFTQISGYSQLPFVEVFVVRTIPYNRYLTSCPALPLKDRAGQGFQQAAMDKLRIIHP